MIANCRAGYSTSIISARCAQLSQAQDLYLGTCAYPAAKQLIQSRLGYRSGIRALIDQCRTDCPSKLWDELAGCDYDAELERLIDWWPMPRQRGSPTDDVEVLLIALEDLPYRFSLRGNAKWSRDPEDWQWWYEDDYAGPQFSSQVMSLALERAEVHDQAQPRKRRRRKDAAGDAYEVVEMFVSLGYFGL